MKALQLKRTCYGQWRQRSGAQVESFYPAQVVVGVGGAGGMRWLVGGLPGAKNAGGTADVCSGHGCAVWVVAALGVLFRSLVVVRARMPLYSKFKFTGHAKLAKA